MNVEYSKDFEKSVKKLSGKMLDSIRKVITEVKNAENIKDITSYITPVPGGVGPLTIAMLANNLLEACKMQER